MGKADILFIYSFNLYPASIQNILGGIQGFIGQNQHLELGSEVYQQYTRSNTDWIVDKQQYCAPAFQCRTLLLKMQFGAKL